MDAIILCGGEATRLGALAIHTPKSLLRVGAKTVLARQAGMLRRAGVRRLILATGHLHERFEQEAEAESNGLPVAFAREEARLDTGGAIAHAMRRLETDGPFFVLNGDVLTDIPLSGMVNALPAEAEGILLGYPVDDVSPYGEIETEPTGTRITAFREKRSGGGPGWINAGVYLLRPSISKHFPSATCFSIERDVFPFAKSVHLYQGRGRWIDIGTPERLEEASGMFVPEES